MNVLYSLMNVIKSVTMFLDVTIASVGLDTSCNLTENHVSKVTGVTERSDGHRINLKRII